MYIPTTQLTQGAAASAEDSVRDVLGSPDTAFEFNSSSFSGLTALGTPAAEDAHTTIPGHYYVRFAGSGWVGRWCAASVPFTVVVKLTERTADEVSGVKAGVFVADASPSGTGDGDALLIGNGDRAVWVELMQTTNIFDAIASVPQSAYLAIRVNSSSDVDYLYSQKGYIWRKVVDSRDLSAIGPIASCGLAIASNGSVSIAAAFDFMRIWNSAKTFPGALA